MPRQEVIHLHLAAPRKPEEGEACNGCGVCCALETCPAARLLFLRKAGPCPALQWSAANARYQCGLLISPRKFIGWLPKVAEKTASRLFTRSIAAGCGCDCSAEPEHRPGN